MKRKSAYARCMQETNHTYVPIAQEYATYANCQTLINVFLFKLMDFANTLLKYQIVQDFYRVLIKFKNKHYFCEIFSRW